MKRNLKVSGLATVFLKDCTFITKKPVWQAAVINCINCVLYGYFSGGFLLCNQIYRSVAQSVLLLVCFHST